MGGTARGSYALLPCRDQSGCQARSARPSCSFRSVAAVVGSRSLLDDHACLELGCEAAAVYVVLAESDGS